MRYGSPFLWAPLTIFLTIKPLFMKSLLHDFRGILHSSRFLERVSLLLLVVLLTTRSFAQIAPVNPPTGGFHIDGNLRANIPTANAGDWLFGWGGTGGFVLNNNGTAVDPAHTGRRIDLFNSNSDSIFTQGSKFQDVITSLRWGTGKPPQKDDIHNALFHISTNPNDGHQWAFMAGDRLSTSGTSYLDFEFLQGTVTMNANGTFTGSGPDDGRTNNDIVLSMRYESGGENTRVLIYRWSDTTHEYKLIDTALTSSFAYAKTNLDTIAVPYGAFGSTTYSAFAFVEGGVDLTQLISLTTGGNCIGLSIKTLWIKTKASASNTAALKDLFKPIPVSLTFGEIELAPIGPFCVYDQAITLVGNPAGGTFSGPGVSGTTFTPATAGPGTHQIIYAASVGNNCTKNDTIFITVNARPTVSVNSPSRCSNGPAVTITATPSGTGPFTYAWTVPGGVANPGNVSSFPASVGGQYCVVVTDANGCASLSTCGTLTVNNPTTLNAGTYGPFCITASPAVLGGTPAGGTWSGTGVSFVSGNYQFSPTTAGAGSFVLTYNFTNANSCTSTITANVTVNAQPSAPSVTYNPPACDETTFSVTITNVANGATYTIKDKNGANIPGVSPGNSVVAPNTNNIIFSNIPAGSGYQVTVSVTSCTSGPNSCGAAALARTGSEATEVARPESLVMPKELAVKAYPNPFSDRIKFVVTSPIAGQGILEVYNSMGQMVKTVYKGYIESGTQTFDMNLPAKQTSQLIYLLRVADKKVSGKLLQVNQ
jgi:hypothetical protein